MGVVLKPITLTPGVPIPISLINLGNIQSIKVTNNSPFDLTVSGFGVQGQDIVAAKSEIRLYAAVKNEGYFNIFPVNNTGTLGSGTANIVVYDVNENLPPGAWPQAVSSLSGQTLASPDPTFVATVDYEATIGFGQILNVSNPANSGMVYVFESARGYTNDAPDITRIVTFITPGGDLAYVNPVPINPISDQTSVSTAHASASDANNVLAQKSKIIEIYHATQRVTAELANVPITIYPNNNLSLLLSSLNQNSKVSALTLKWLENAIASGGGPSGGGPAVPTLTGIFSPLDFQAVGNGFADDTVPLQNTIAAANSLGYGIILLNGLFKISSALTITQSNIGFVGLGEGTGLTIANGSNVYAIVMNLVAGITGFFAKNFKIQCNAANQTAGGGINANGGYRNVYEDLWVEAPYDAGLLLQNGPGGVGSFGYQNILRNVKVMDGNLSAGNGRGVYIVTNDENRLDHCFFQNNGGSNGNDNYDVRDDNGLTVYDGCTFVNSKGGIKVYATGNPAAGIGVVNCVFDGLGSGAGASACINLSGGGGNSIIGNRFLNIGFNANAANTVDGIYTKGINDRIIGNIFNPAGDGKNGCKAMVELDGTNGQDYGRVNLNTFLANIGGSTQITTDGAPAHNDTTLNTLH
jgi:hypothetical protein